MHKARYWLLLNIAKRPKAFTYGAGLIVGCTLVLVTVIGTVWHDYSQTAHDHNGALRIFRAITTESTELLAHLHHHNDLDCNAEGLIHLNSHLLETRYLREIGLMNDNLGLICSTALGALPEPVKGNYPVHVSRSGLELLNNVPLTMASKKLGAMIIQRPPFNVVVSPYATDELYTSADAVWLRTRDGLTLLNTTPAPATAVRTMKARALSLDSSRFRLHGSGYELITVTSDLDVVLQTRRNMWQIAQQNNAVLIVQLIASLLVSALAIGAISPRVARLGDMRHRLAFLCNDDHLTLVYQPLFDLRTMRLVGCEVLARLTEENQSWMPNVVIPALQDAGLERSFDRAVTQKAIRELGAQLPPWDGMFQLALNYFPRSVRPDELVPVLQAALAATGRDDMEICIEVTEHSLSSELINEVQSLKANGFVIAVDDFGTGYSNLKSVTQLAPHLLKIDRSFIYELEDATLRSNLIPEIVRIAQAIGAQTVAEGIENMEQVQLLVEAGVRYGQGHALAHPMNITAFVSFVSQHAKRAHTTPAVPAA